MQILGFLGWLFDFSRWESYSLRYAFYMLIGICGSFIVPYAGLITVGLLLIDFGIDIMREKYQQYLKEMVDNIEPVEPPKAGPSKMMME